MEDQRIAPLNSKLIHHKAHAYNLFFTYKLSNSFLIFCQDFMMFCPRSKTEKYINIIMNHSTDMLYNNRSPLFLIQTSYMIGNIVWNNKYIIIQEFQLAKLGSLARVKVFNLQVVL